MLGVFTKSSLRRNGDGYRCPLHLWAKEKLSGVHIVTGRFGFRVSEWAKVHKIMWNIHCEKTPKTAKEAKNSREHTQCRVVRSIEFEHDPALLHLEYFTRETSH